MLKDFCLDTASNNNNDKTHVVNYLLVVFIARICVVCLNPNHIDCKL